MVHEIHFHIKRLTIFDTNFMNKANSNSKAKVKVKAVQI